MFIDTHSIQTITASIRELTGISFDLYSYNNEPEAVYHFEKVVRDRIFDCITNEIDEVLFFHLSRRLNSTADDCSTIDLLCLLSTDNEVTRFFKRYNIQFDYVNDHVLISYDENVLNWENDYSTKIYMDARLGKGVKPDYSQNGFLFRDLINNSDYFKNLRIMPEFFCKLLRYLHLEEAINEYYQNSTYYCFEYRVPIERVYIEGSENNSIQKKKECLAHCILERLLFARNKIYSFRYTMNPLLHLENGDLLSKDLFVNIEKLSEN